MKLSERLKELRINNNLTQQNIANKLFISRSLYAKFENDISIPSDETLKQIADIYLVSVDDLINFKKSGVFSNQQNTSKPKSQRIISFILISFYILYIVFYFIPIFSVYSYVYPAPIGEQPKRVSTWMSSFLLLNNKNVWVGNITLIISIVGIIYSILFLKVFKNNKRFLFPTVCIVFVVFLIMSFLTIAYSCGYTF